MVKQAVPFIEVYNREQIVEAGHKYKEEIFKLKQEIQKTGGKSIGTLAGDRYIDEAENDPNIILRELEEEDANDNEGSLRGDSYKAKQLGQLFNRM